MSFKGLRVSGWAWLLIVAALLVGTGYGAYTYGRRVGTQEGVALGRRLEQKARRDKPVLKASAWEGSALSSRLRVPPALSPEEQVVFAKAVNNAPSPCSPERQGGVSLGDCLMKGGTCGSCLLQGEAIARAVDSGLRDAELEFAATKELWQEFNIDGAPSQGPADAPVVLTEWSDFQCPYCKESAETARELLARYPQDLRLVWVDRPLESIHPRARQAAVAARAAHAQGKFWEYHDALFARQKEMTRLRTEAQGEEFFEAVATTVGLDLPAFRLERDRPEADAAVGAQVEMARALGITGTPSLFVGNRKMVRSRALEDLSRVVEEARAQGWGRPEKVGAFAPSPVWEEKPSTSPPGSGEARATGEQASPVVPDGASRAASSPPSP